MQTRRDQVQAHSFVMSRLVSAMLRAEPDSPVTPHRRFVVGWICGLIAGAVVMAACGVYGFIFPGGSTEWTQPGVLIVEKETGTRYVYVEETLRPVANYTSARLLLGGEPVVVRVARASMSGVPHGLPIGIPAAPDDLPDVKRLDGTKWLVCSALREDAAGARQPYVTLNVGATMTGDALGDDRGLIVRTPDGALYLAWHERRLRIPSAAELSVLGYASAQPYPVGWAWLDVVPAGPDLNAPDLPGRGQPGPVIDGQRTTVGQLFQVSEAVTGRTGVENYVVRTDGLSPVTTTGAALLLADPRTKVSYPNGAVRALALTAAGLAQGPISRDQTVNPLHPPAPPVAANVGPDRAACVQVTMDADKGPQASIALGSPPPAGPATSVVTVRDPRLADRVVVEPGAGLLIQDQPAPGVMNGTLHLLVDTGVRYPLAGADAAKALGYGEVTAIPVPAALLDLIPAGRTLSLEAARATLPASGSSNPEGGSTQPSS